MISDAAVSLGIQVVKAKVQPGQKVYRVRDVFTTRDGSWEPNPSIPYSIPQWARDAGYLKPWGAPDYLDDAGADHHILGCVWNPATKTTDKSAIIHYYTWTDNGNHVDMAVKPKSGWANVVMFNNYNPDAGERGAWAWYPRVPNVAADIVQGAGMPHKWHVSFFASWELVTEGDSQPEPQPDTQLRKDVDSLIVWAEAMNKAHPGGPQYVRPS